MFVLSNLIYLYLFQSVYVAPYTIYAESIQVGTVVGQHKQCDNVLFVFTLPTSQKFSFSYTYPYWKTLTDVAVMFIFVFLKCG